MRTRIVRTARTMVMIGVVGLLGCGPPTIRDTDLRIVRDPILLAAIDYGWLAVDSTETGVRAVLQLEIEAPRESSDYLVLHTPALRCSLTGIHYPAEVRREDPVCSTPVNEPVCPPDYGGDPESCRIWANADVCLHVVRAVFYFKQMPHFDDSHYFTFGQISTLVQWASSEDR